MKIKNLIFQVVLILAIMVSGYCHAEDSLRVNLINSSPTVNLDLKNVDSLKPLFQEKGKSFAERNAPYIASIINLVVALIAVGASYFNLVKQIRKNRETDIKSSDLHVLTDLTFKFLRSARLVVDELYFNTNRNDELWKEYFHNTHEWRADIHDTYFQIIILLGDNLSASQEEAVLKQRLESFVSAVVTKFDKDRLNNKDNYKIMLEDLVQSFKVILLKMKSDYIGLI